MSRQHTAAVIGEAALVQGFGLVGARVLPAESADDVRRCWAALPSDVLLVILTPAAHAALEPLPDDRGPLWIVMPSTAVMTHGTTQTEAGDVP